jgi:hypothetical protein
MIRSLVLLITTPNMNLATSIHIKESKLLVGPGLWDLNSDPDPVKMPDPYSDLDPAWGQSGEHNPRLNRYKFRLIRNLEQ